MAQRHRGTKAQRDRDAEVLRLISVFSVPSVVIYIMDPAQESILEFPEPVLKIDFDALSLFPSPILSLDGHRGMFIGKRWR